MSICQIIKNNNDVINFELQDNQWTLLELNVDNSLFHQKIKDITIDNESIQELIYCSWFENNDKQYFQPCTEFWDQAGVWRIMLHSDIAITINAYRSQISNNDFGINLKEKYQIIYDQGIELDNEFPLSIKQFFAHSFGPLYHNRSNIRNIPSFRYNTQIDINKMFDSLLSFRLEPGNVPYTKSWKTNNITSPEENQYIRQVMQDVGMYKLHHAGYYTLGPKGYIPLHKDDLIKGNTEDSWKIYFAKQPGSLFKLNRSGILHIDQQNKSFILDTRNQVHSVVNISDQPRDVIVLNGFCDNSRIQQHFIS